MYVYPEVRPSRVKNTFLVAETGHVRFATSASQSVRFVSHLLQLRPLSASPNPTIFINGSIAYIYRASLSRGRFHVPQNGSHVDMLLPKAKRPRRKVRRTRDSVVTLESHYAASPLPKTAIRLFAHSQTRRVFDSNPVLIVPLFTLFPSSLFLPSTTTLSLFCCLSLRLLPFELTQWFSQFSFRVTNLLAVYHLSLSFFRLRSLWG